MVPYNILVVLRTTRGPRSWLTDMCYAYPSHSLLWMHTVRAILDASPFGSPSLVGIVGATQIPASREHHSFSATSNSRLRTATQDASFATIGSTTRRRNSSQPPPSPPTKRFGFSPHQHSARHVHPCMFGPSSPVRSTLSSIPSRFLSCPRLSLPSIPNPLLTMQTTAFLPAAPVAATRLGGGRATSCQRLTTHRSLAPAVGAPTRRPSPLWRRAAVVAMATPPPDGGEDDGLDAAERTRRALSAEPPAVVFRNKYDPSGGLGGTDGGEGEGFGYSSGSTGVDVWLIGGICTLAGWAGTRVGGRVGGEQEGVESSLWTSIEHLDSVDLYVVPAKDGTQRQRVSLCLV